MRERVSVCVCVCLSVSVCVWGERDWRGGEGGVEKREGRVVLGEGLAVCSLCVLLL